VESLPGARSIDVIASMLVPPDGREKCEDN